eukprot:3847205-Amphidinium_carterae.1
MAMAQKVLAAIIWSHPHLGKGRQCGLVLSKQALKGWTRLKPPGRRLPLPYCVVMMLCMHLCYRKQRELALVLWLMVETYARPGELFRLSPQDVVPPMPRAGRAHKHVSIILHPREVGKTSKTGDFDET